MGCCFCTGQHALKKALLQSHPISTTYIIQNSSSLDTKLKMSVTTVNAKIMGSTCSCDVLAVLSCLYIA